MKKTIALIIISILAFTLVSCADTGDKGTPTPEGTKTAEASGTNTPDNPPDKTEHIHSYGEWKITEDPSCEKTGKQERACSCGEKQQEDIAVIDHKYVNGVCSMCNKKDPSVFVPDYKKGQENTVGSDMSMGTYCSQGNWIYFSPTAYKISKITKMGTNQTPVYEIPSGKIQNLNVVGDWIYFYCEGMTEGKSYIAKVRTDGSGFAKILSGVQIWDMLVVKDRIFYTQYNETYSDYAKDCYPLYSISTNGGAAKMIHDGAVNCLRSDGKYVYYHQQAKDGVSSVSRIKYDGTEKSKLVSFKKGEGIVHFTLCDSKIYFLRLDKYSDECTIGSIAANGGSYTTYGKTPFHSDFLYVVGSKVYYHGGAFDSQGFPTEAYGLVEFNTATKKYKVIKEGDSSGDYFFTDGMILCEGYTGETLTKLTVYNCQNGSTLNFKIK
ncbi:MAG: DUF5050 domain-containing protein [Ruminococcaceae bacterium]|nr:DUF5050 domain-containing protein [Oscillospiraceae bacterium]